MKEGKKEAYKTFLLTLFARYVPENICLFFAKTSLLHRVVDTRTLGNTKYLTLWTSHSVNKESFSITKFNFLLKKTKRPKRFVNSGKCMCIYVCVHLCMFAFMCVCIYIYVCMYDLHEATARAWINVIEHCFNSKKWDGKLVFR